MPYYDLRDNFPEIYWELKNFYYEGLESYRVPQSVTWTRKSSRSSVKRTAKHQHSLKQMHKLESQLQPELRAEFGYLKSNALMRLDFRGKRGLGYVAETNFGYVMVIPNGFRRWTAFATNKRDEIFVWVESKISHKQALADLFKKPWGVHLTANHTYTYSAYQLYRGVYFNFEDSPQKHPRNTARVWKMNPELKPLWA